MPGGPIPEAFMEKPWGIPNGGGIIIPVGAMLEGVPWGADDPLVAPWSGDGESDTASGRIESETKTQT